MTKNVPMIAASGVVLAVGLSACSTSSGHHDSYRGVCLDSVTHVQVDSAACYGDTSYLARSHHGAMWAYVPVDSAETGLGQRVTNFVSDVPQGSRVTSFDAPSTSSTSDMGDPVDASASASTPTTTVRERTTTTTTHRWTSRYRR